MEQQKGRDDLPSPKPWPITSKGDFFKSVFVSRFDRYGMPFLS